MNEAVGTHSIPARGSATPAQEGPTADEIRWAWQQPLVLGDSLLLPTRLKIDPPAIQPASATRAFWNDWAGQPSSEQAIVDGVEALRRQVRPSGWRDAISPVAR